MDLLTIFKKIDFVDILMFIDVPGGEAPGASFIKNPSISSESRRCSGKTISIINQFKREIFRKSAERKITKGQEINNNLATLAIKPKQIYTFCQNIEAMGGDPLHEPFFFCFPE
jgi:hypothetical protein